MTRMPVWLAAGVACAATFPFVATRPRPAEAPAAGQVVDRAPEAVAVAARSLAKAYLAEEVIRGRRTVPEAAAVFGWLNRQPPAIDAADIRHRFPRLSAGADEAEVLCAQVTGFIVGTLRCANPARESELVRTGQEQMDAVRDPTGRLILPAVREADCRELVRRAMAASMRRETGGAADFEWIGEGLVLIER
jgi:hypothetical protein